MERHAAAGEILVRREEITPFLFVIRSGRVRIRSTHREWILSPGDFFGEEGALLRKPAPYTAFAAEESLLELFEQAEASAFLSGEPALALRMVSRTAAQLHEYAAPLSPASPRYLRILKHLVPHAPQPGPDPAALYPLSLSAEALASIMEVETPFLLTLLREAEQFGDVRIDTDGTLRSRDREQLRSRIATARNAAYFFSGPSDRTGAGHFNLFSRIDLKQEGTP